MKTQTIALFVLLCILYSCSTDAINDAKEKILIPETLQAYFPPINSNTWETVSIQELGWKPEAEQPLLDFLEEKDTKAFILLKNGYMVIEAYFNGNDATSNNAWNSAGKTITSMTVGLAQEEGFLSLDDSSSDYLGIGWSSLTPEQEQKISIRNQLTMTSGLDYTIDDSFCYDIECLQYKNEPGNYWFYHNAPYTLLDRVITSAVGKNFELYFKEKIRDKIGMQGAFIEIGYNNVYFSNARSMARFGILNLNNGVWNGESIISNTSYLQAMKNTSQDLNPSYGYLYWLNGKEKYRIPGSEIEFLGKLIPNAPDDLYAGLGANNQKLYVVPSKELIIIRMGNDAGESNLGPSSFDDKLWGKINDLIN